MNEYEMGKDIGALEARVRALEEAHKQKGSCGCGSSPGKQPDGTIKLCGVAQITDEPADLTIVLKPDTGPHGFAVQPFAEGQTRQYWYGGVCYCQMICGGQWQYLCYSSGYCIQCPGGVNVNCNGTIRNCTCT